MNIVLVDIETAPNLAYVWDKYEQDVIAFSKERYLLCFAYAQLGGKVKVVALPDFKTYKKDKEDDSELVKALWDVFDSADVIVAHNGNNFDIRMSNAFFIKHGLTPPSPYKTVDTRNVARAKFRFNSNKLTDLGSYLGLGEKLQTGGFSLWRGCLAGDMKSWNLMKKYNAQDIVLLEKVYLKLRPWMTNHPNVNVLPGRPNACPVCGSTRIQSRGLGVSSTRTYRQYRCMSCGHCPKSVTTEKSLVTTK